MLQSLMDSALEPAYAERSARDRELRDRGDRARARWPRQVATALILALAVAILTIAVLGLRASEPTRAERRTALADEVGEQDSAVHDLQSRITAEEADVDELRAQVLGSDGEPDPGAAVGATPEAAGLTPVTGPALVVTLDDADPADVRGDPDLGRVLDIDLQSTVNGLFEAGAEAVDVNGQRITAVTAIRAAGDAILVNFRPLARPYVVTAIGAPGDLRAVFLRTQAGHGLVDLEDSYGVRVDMSDAASATVPRSRRAAAALRRGCAAVIPAIGLVVGLVLGIVLQPVVPLGLQPYLPIAVVAALDAVFGATRALLEGVFNDRVFVVSFLGNVAVAALVVFVGDQLGVGSQLSTGVVVVFSVRIFANAAAIRRKLFRA